MGSEKAKHLSEMIEEYETRLKAGVGNDLLLFYNHINKCIYTGGLCGFLKEAVLNFYTPGMISDSLSLSEVVHNRSIHPSLFVRILFMLINDIRENHNVKN